MLVYTMTVTTTLRRTNMRRTSVKLDTSRQPYLGSLPHALNEVNIVPIDSSLEKPIQNGRYLPTVQRPEFR